MSSLSQHVILVYIQVHLYSIICIRLESRAPARPQKKPTELLMWSGFQCRTTSFKGEVSVNVMSMCAKAWCMRFFCCCPKTIKTTIISESQCCICSFIRNTLVTLFRLETSHKTKNNLRFSVSWKYLHVFSHLLRKKSDSSFLKVNICWFLSFSMTVNQIYFSHVSFGKKQFFNIL